MSVTTLPASTGTALAPHVLVGGNDLSTALTDALVELRVLVGVRTVGRCTLRFAAPGFELATGSPFGLGTEVKVLARGTEQGAALVTVFVGAVTSVGLDQRAGGTPELVVVVQDKAWPLTHATATETLVKRSYVDAVTDLVKPLTVSASGLPTEEHQYLLRSGTPLGFVDEVARRTGASWVVHEDTFYLWVGDGPVTEAVTLAARTALHEFSVRVTDDAPSEITVRGWDSHKQEAVQASATVPRTLPGSLSRLTGPVPSASRTRLVADLGPLDATEAKHLAKAVAAGRGRVLARGRGPVRPELRPGGTVTIEEMGPANATYPVREVEHVYTRTGFQTRFVAGDRDAVAPPGASQVAADGAASPGFRHAGLVVGKVSRLSLDPGDRSDGIAPKDEQVMALVALPGVDGALTTHWARLATVGGGPSSGVQFLPEIDDEVVVGFEGGDVRRPVVLGGLHGGKAKIPTGLTGEDTTKVERRRLVSRRGHVIEMSDGTKPATEFIRLNLQDGKVFLRLGKDRADLEVPSGTPLRIAAGKSFLEMDGNGAVTVEGTTISIKGTQKVTVEGMEVVVKGTNKVSTSAAQVELKGQATATVEAGGQTVIKGGMVQIN